MKYFIILMLVFLCSCSCSKNEFSFSTNNSDLTTGSESTPTPPVTPPPEQGFVTTWDIPIGDLGLTIPVYGFFTYDFTIDWGDGTPVENYTNADLNVTHLYALAGNYEVTITGDFPYMGGWNSCAGDSRLIDVKQWGDIEWLNMRRMFCGSGRVNFSASDAPDLSQVDDMHEFLREAHLFDSNINHWNVSQVQDFTGFFYDATVFNQPLNNWNMSNARYLDQMFRVAEMFNQNINNWNISQAISMNEMFRSAFTFDQPLGNWNVSQVTSMSGTFYNAYKFKQDISSWNVSSVVRMNQMFKGSYRFNSPLNSWNVSSVEDFSEMFSRAISFDRPLNSWNFSAATNLSLMFEKAWSMTQDLSCWSVPITANYSNFADDKNPAFTLPNLGGVASGSCVVLGAVPTPVIVDSDAFVSTWKTTGTNQTIDIPLSSWYDDYQFDIDWGDGTTENINISSYAPLTHTYTNPGYYHITISNIVDFPGLSYSACSRNNFPENDARAQLVALNQWGSNQWQILDRAFCGASNLETMPSIAPDLSSVSSLDWLFEAALKMNGHFNNWNVSNIYSLGGTFSYAHSFNAPLNNWNTSNVYSMYSTFQHAHVFNQDLSTWDTSNVQRMDYMFYFSLDYNQPLNNWDTSGLENAESMFYHAINFNQPLGNWVTTSITNMTATFHNAHNFNQNLSCWNVTQFATEPYDSFYDEYTFGNNRADLVKPIWGTDGSTGTCSF